jgi:hypothetical protein
MSTTAFLVNGLFWLEWAACLAALVFVLRSGQARTFRFLTAFLVVHAVTCSALPFMMEHMALFHLTVKRAYGTYFYGYWSSYALASLLTLGVVVDLYRLAMEPLKGLQSLGMLMFRWAAAISAVLSVAFGLSSHLKAETALVRAVMQFQQTQSVLTLCMLCFVCYAIHPMGLSYRSRIFGVSLGLGLSALTDLVCGAWAALRPGANYVQVSVVTSVAFCVCAAIWSTYFYLPERRRKLILLPTTSPFFRWNQISEALGDAPGYAAVGPVTLDMFAPAELEVMRRASDKITSANA